MWQRVDPYWDDKIKSMVYGFNGDWMVSVTPMIFNDRICLTSTDDYPFGYTAGWCFPKGGAAALAAMIWNPEEEREPQGYIKMAFDSRGVTT